MILVSALVQKSDISQPPFCAAFFEVSGAEWFSFSAATPVGDKRTPLTPIAPPSPLLTKRKNHIFINWRYFTKMPVFLLFFIKRSSICSGGG